MIDEFKLRPWWCFDMIKARQLRMTKMLPERRLHYVVSLLAISATVLVFLHIRKWAPVLEPSKRHHILRNNQLQNMQQDINFAQLVPRDETRWNLTTWRAICQRFGDLTSPLNYKYVMDFDIASVTFSRTPRFEDDRGQVVVCVVSDPKHFEERSAIRDTWGGALVKSGALVYFLVGQTEEFETDENVLKESTEFKDMLVGDFKDDYYNLTLKSMLLLKWSTEQCPNAGYVIKSDDDVFMNVTALLNFIDGINPETDAIYGHIHVQASLKYGAETGKWYVDRRLYPWEKYPEYANGPIYFMTMIAAKKLVDAATGVPHLYLYFIEDVFVTGMLTTITKSSLIHIAAMSRKKTMVSCCGVMASPGISASEQRRRWNAMNRPVFRCHEMMVDDEETKDYPVTNTTRYRRCRKISGNM